MKASLVMLLLAGIMLRYQAEDYACKTDSAEVKEGGVNEENCFSLGSSQQNMYCGYDGSGNCVPKPYCTKVNGDYYTQEKNSKGEAFNCGDYPIKDDPEHNVCVYSYSEYSGEKCLAGSKDCATTPIPEKYVTQQEKSQFCKGFTADQNFYERNCALVGDACAPVPQKCSNTKYISESYINAHTESDFCSIFTVEDTVHYQSTCGYSGNKCALIPLPCDNNEVPEEEINAGSEIAFCSLFGVTDKNQYKCGYDSTSKKCVETPKECDNNSIPAGTTDKSAYCQVFTVTDTFHYESTCIYDSTSDQCVKKQIPCNNNDIPDVLPEGYTKMTFCGDFSVSDLNHYSKCTMDIATMSKCVSNQKECSTTDFIPPLITDKITYCEGFKVADTTRYDACTYKEGMSCYLKAKGCDNNSIPAGTTDKSAYCQVFTVTDTFHYESTCVYDSTSDQCARKQIPCNNNNIPDVLPEGYSKMTFCGDFGVSDLDHYSKCTMDIATMSKCVSNQKECSTTDLIPPKITDKITYCEGFKVTDTNQYSTCSYKEGMSCYLKPKECNNNAIPDGTTDKSAYCQVFTVTDTDHYESTCAYDSTSNKCKPTLKECDDNIIPNSITATSDKTSYCSLFKVTDTNHYESTCGYDEVSGNCNPTLKECNNNAIPGDITQAADKTTFCEIFKVSDTNHYESTCAVDTSSNKCRPTQLDCSSTPRSFPALFDGDKEEYCKGFSTSATNKECIPNEGDTGCEEISKRVACTETEGGKCARLGLVDEPKIYKCTEKEDDPTKCELVQRTCREGQMDSTKEDCRILPLENPDDADEVGCFVKSGGGCEPVELCNKNTDPEGGLEQADCDILPITQTLSYYHYICKVSTDGKKCEETQLGCDNTITYPEAVDDAFCGGFAVSSGKECKANADGTGCEEKDVPSQDSSSFIITISLVTFLAFFL